MKALLVAIALLAACRGERKTNTNEAGPSGSASRVSVVPKLPGSADGVDELRRLDAEIDVAKDLATATALRLERAAIRGRLDDYTRVLADTASLVEKTPDEVTWRLRVRALLATHDFAQVPAAIAQLGKLVDKSHLVEYEVSLAQATGDRVRALAGREQLAKERLGPIHFTLLAVTLAEQERFADAIALVPKAAAVVRNNTPQLLAWLLFQWGRIYEMKGEPATARDFFAAAHARLPGYVEATAHLARALIATGDRTAARTLVDGALASDRHPELLALAGELGNKELVAEAGAAWEKYVTALPKAFADHAARFYLGPGADPKRALELARIDHANRDTHGSRGLVIEAALAAKDPAAACAVVEPLIKGTRAEQFVAWRAVSACGRSDDATLLAKQLGIASQTP